MSKIQVFLISLAFVVIAFTFGYKVGDAHGYNEGYDVGYRYDCKDEIALLYERVKAQKKFTEVTSENLKSLLRENDSLRNPAVIRRRQEDSLARYRQFAADSAVYWKSARQYNGGHVKKYFGYDTSETNIRIVGDDGKLSGTMRLQCLVRDDFKDLPECQAGWRLK